MDKEKSNVMTKKKSTHTVYCLGGRTHCLKRGILKADFSAFREAHISITTTRKQEPGRTCPDCIQKDKLASDWVEDGCALYIHWQVDFSLATFSRRDPLSF